MSSKPLDKAVQAVGSGFEDQPQPNIPTREEIEREWDLALPVFDGAARATPSDFANYLPISDSHGAALATPSDFANLIHLLAWADNGLGAGTDRLKSSFSRVMGGDDRSEALFSRLMERSLNDLAEKVKGEASKKQLKNAAKAFSKSLPYWFVNPDAYTGMQEDVDPWLLNRGKSIASAEDMISHLDGLVQGEHLLIQMSQTVSMRKQGGSHEGGGSHATSVWVTRTAEDEFSLCYANSNFAQPTIEVRELGKTQVEEALKQLTDKSDASPLKLMPKDVLVIGSLLPNDAMAIEDSREPSDKMLDVYQKDGLLGRLSPAGFVGFGAPLAVWLRSVAVLAKKDVKLSEEINGLEPISQATQKNGSCLAESKFAFLRTVLPKETYKLAKAYFLETVIGCAKNFGVCDQRLFNAIMTRSVNARIRSAPDLSGGCEKTDRQGHKTIDTQSVWARAAEICHERALERLKNTFGNDVNVMASQSSGGHTPLVRAILNDQPSGAHRLIGDGADVNLAPRGSLTPVMMAASGDSSVLSRMMDAKANYRDRDESGTTALMLAAKSPKLYNVDLLSGPSSGALRKDKNNRTALWYAAEAGELDNVKLLVKKYPALIKKDPLGYEIALKAAQQAGRLDLVKEFEALAKIPG
ncbi:MAG: ankyrin repeat domain-containing protein [Burkholderiaceae bacterium]